MQIIIAITLRHRASSHLNLHTRDRGVNISLRYIKLSISTAAVIKSIKCPRQSSKDSTQSFFLSSTLAFADHEGHEASPGLGPADRPPRSAAGGRHRGQQLPRLPLPRPGGGLGALPPGGALLQRVRLLQTEVS